MGKEVKNFFNNKFVFMISVILLFSAISVFADNIIVNEHGIKAHNYIAGDGSEGITQDIVFKDGNGNNQVMNVVDGIVVGVSDDGGEDPLEEGLLIHYRFEDNNANTIVLDKTGNHDGTLYGGDNTEDKSIIGKIDKAFLLNGFDDYITLSNEAELRFNSDSEDFTLVFWIKLTNKDKYQMIIDKREDTADGWMLRVSDSNTLQFNIGATQIESNTALDVNTWYHIGVVADRSGYVHFYLDNQADGGGDISGIQIDTTVNPYLGLKSFGDHSQKLDASIDEFGIWNRVLTEGEIEELYLEGKNEEGLFPKGGLVAYWNFEETSGNIVYDQTGNGYDGVNMGMDYQSTGIVNYGYYSKTNEQDEIDFGDMSLSESGLSASFWIKPESLSKYTELLTKFLDGGNQRSWLFGGVSGGNIFWEGCTSGDNPSCITHVIYTPSPAPNGVWTHLAFTFNGTHANLYMNGTLVNSTAMQKIVDTPANIWFGGYEGEYTDRSFDGFIDEIGIWNRTLNDEEILALYNEGEGFGYN